MQEFFFFFLCLLSIFNADQVCVYECVQIVLSKRCL